MGYFLPAIIWWGGILLIAIIFTREHYAAIARGKAHLEKLIKQRGGMDIQVRRSPQRMQDAIIYDVSFQDSTGIYRETHCQIGQKFGGLGAIYWQDEPFLEANREQLATIRSENADLRTQLAHRSATKEEIISRLAAENDRLRARLEKAKRPLIK